MNHYVQEWRHQTEVQSGNQQYGYQSRCSLFILELRLSLKKHETWKYIYIYIYSVELHSQPHLCYQRCTKVYKGKKRGEMSPPSDRI